MISTRTRFYSALCLVIGLTLGVNSFHRSTDVNRDRQLQLAAQSLGNVPHHFGNWHFEGEAPLSKNAEDLLQCSAYLNHTYRNQQTGSIVGVVLLLGQAGPLVAHTPQVCMATQEYEPLGQSKPFSLSTGDEDQQFLEARFTTKALDGSDVTIYYGWSRDGVKWEAPTHPRLTLSPSPFLYKIQIVMPTVSLSGDDPEDVCRAFLQEFIPVVRESIVASESVTTKVEI